MKLTTTTVVAAIGVLGFFGTATAAAHDTDAAPESKAGNLLFPAAEFHSSAQNGSQSAFDIKELEGKRLWRATIIAKRRGYVVRVTSRNGQNLPATADYRSDRINVSIMGSKGRGWTVTDVGIG